MYLLLRDNKQSGPYSFDELKAKGLKAYDLVWVEGRSAAWRYPSEVEELSAFAPAVEEQPFDRFFKKPAPAVEMPANMAAVTKTQAVSSSNPTTTKRTIYVTMPGGIAARENVRDTNPTRETSPAREIVREITPVREMVREITPVREKVSYMREPVTEILPPLPRRKPSRLWLPVAIGGGVLLLLTTGIFIGLSLQKDAPGTHKIASRSSKDNEQPLVRTTAQQLPVTPVTNNGVGATSASNVGNAQGTVTGREGNKPRVAAPKQKTEAPKTQAMVPAVAADSPDVQPVTHRETMHRTEAVQSQPADDHEGLKLALANEVSVGTNKYDVGTLGGIHNLQVTVTNRSAYSLDLVVVAVSYVQANKKTYKTENLYFRGIGPGSALMLEAPKSSRGINVQYKITSINSKELGLSEPGI